MMRGLFNRPRTTICSLCWFCLCACRTVDGEFEAYVEYYDLFVVAKFDQVFESGCLDKVRKLLFRNGLKNLTNAVVIYSACRNWVRVV